MADMVLIVQQPDPVPVVVVAQQGPPGPTPTPDQIGALAVTAELSEFDTAQKKANARTNLELQNIDAGTF